MLFLSNQCNHLQILLLSLAAPPYVYRIWQLPHVLHTLLYTQCLHGAMHCLTLSPYLFTDGDFGEISLVEIGKQSGVHVGAV